MITYICGKPTEFLGYWGRGSTLNDAYDDYRDNTSAEVSPTELTFYLATEVKVAVRIEAVTQPMIDKEK